MGLLDKLLLGTCAVINKFTDREYKYLLILTCNKQDLPKEV
jgi:hypothetical protein